MGSETSSAEQGSSGWRVAGKIGTVGLGIIGFRHGLHADSFDDLVATAGMGMTTISLGYLSFRNGFVSRILGDKLQAGEHASNNQRSNKGMAAIGIFYGVIFTAAGVLGAYEDKEPAETATASNPTTTTVDATQTVTANPPNTISGGGESTVLAYPCELGEFSSDGDGFPGHGSSASIAKLEAGINEIGPQLGIEPFPVTGNLVDNPASLAGIEVFKQWAVARLGEAYTPGPEGQVTPQMCTLVESWVDGDPKTP